MPLVSIVMPIRNEARYIHRSLNAVLAQDYPANCMEVIVADGMSEDGTRKIVQSLVAQYPNLRLIDNPGKIVSSGLNTAIEQASGEIITRVDGHCEISRDYIQRCVEHIQNDGVDAVGGFLHIVGETLVAKIIACAMGSRFGVGDSNSRTLRSVTRLNETVPFPTYTRAVIRRAGPFDEELVRNQDDEFNYRLGKIGAKILLAADVCSRYYSRGTFRSLWRQYYQYGYWKVRVMQKHPHQMRPRQFVPPLFVIVLLLTLIWSVFSPLGVFFVELIVAIYILAVFITTAGIILKKRRIHLLLLPVAFATIHFSYGVGFLVGLVKFWDRWVDL